MGAPPPQTLKSTTCAALMVVFWMGWCKSGSGVSGGAQHFLERQTAFHCPFHRPSTDRPPTSHCVSAGGCAALLYGHLGTGVLCFTPQVRVCVYCYP